RLLRPACDLGQVLLAAAVGEQAAQARAAAHEPPGGHQPQVRGRHRARGRRPRVPARLDDDVGRRGRLPAGQGEHLRDGHACCAPCARSATRACCTVTRFNTRALAKDTRRAYSTFTPNGSTSLVTSRLIALSMSARPAWISSNVLLMIALRSAAPATSAIASSLSQFSTR